MDLSDRARRAGASLQDIRLLLETTHALARLRDIDDMARWVCGRVRQLVTADGATFVLSEDDYVYYAEEDAREPLWKGCRFLTAECISGWVITHRQLAAVEDVYRDARIPIEEYRRTFVRSLAMVPLGREHPLGSLGAYWAQPHRATARELFLLESLAESSAVALSHASFDDGSLSSA